MHLRIQRADGSERVVGGYKHKERMGRAFQPQLHPSELPPKVDLRPQLTPVEDQGDTNSCVANAVAGAYEYLAKQHTGGDYDVSRMFIYYNARKLEDDQIEDEGTSIGDAIDSLKKFGACAEDTWPFEKSHVNKQPARPAYEEAKQFLVEDMEKVDTDLDLWRHCLAEGRPIIFGLTLYDSFDRARRGRVPMPTDKETMRGKHGKHAMLCVGYSDTDQMFIVRNSWGANWGDAGYCYIPYDYMMNGELNSGDSWVIRQLEGPAEVDRSSWGDEGSILPTIDAELHRMDEAEYGLLLEALGDVPLESRLALVYLAAAASDGEITEDEVKALAEEVQKVHDQLGSELDAQAVLQFAARHLPDQALLDESITLLGVHLSRGMLASILQSMRTIAGADQTSDEEQSFIDMLTSVWEVAESAGGTTVVATDDDDVPLDDTEAAGGDDDSDAGDESSGDDASDEELADDEESGDDTEDDDAEDDDSDDEPNDDDQ